MDNKIVHAAPVPPFVTFVASAVPMVFDNSMSYYEALCALWKWLQDDVINVINNNANVTNSYIDLTNEYIEKFNELKTYVDTYFDNLDVQEEINNKLDAMAEDGTLTELIASVMDYIEVYPESFGAVGDGTTDDTQALQDAIDYAYAHQVNVRLRNKTYVITEPLIIYGNVDPDGKASEIKGNGIGKSIIKKTTDTPGEDYAGNSYDAAFIISKDDPSDHALHNVRLRDFSIQGTSTAHYAIASKLSCAGSEFKSLSIEDFVTAGLYFIGNTYLNRFIQVRVQSSVTGFYIYGGINTSNVFANCYAVSCTNGYKITGSYSQMDSPACDGATNIAYDLENFRGTIISPGCESIHANVVFNFNGSFCTIISPLTFPNYDDATAFHIKLGSGSHVTVIGGRMLWDGPGVGTAAKGGFVDNGYLSNIIIENTLIGNFEKKSTNYAVAASSSKAIQTEYGLVNTYGDESITYIGADGRSTSGLVKTGKTDENLQATAIFMGGGYDKWQTYNGADMGGNRSPMLGDIYLSKRPGEIGGIGWVQTGNATNTNWKTNTMKKIPIVLSGATSDRPVYGLEVGQEYFDTTLNKPVWCKALHGNSSATFTISGGATSAGNINFSIFGITYSIAVTAGESADSIKTKFLAITSPLFKTINVDATRVRYINLAYGSATAPTIDVGTTGATVTKAQDTATNPEWVDATGTAA